MSWGFAAAAVAAVGQGAAAYMGGQAQQAGIASAGAAQSDSLRAQSGITAQQTELARPLVQTRDNALNTINAIFGLPQVSPTLQRSSANGTALVKIPNTVSKTRAGDAPDSATDVFFDPVNQTFVGPNGELLAEANEGTLDRLTNGKDNPVILRNGQLFALTNSAGEVPLATLPGRPETPQAGESATGSGPINGVSSLADLVNTPQLQFEMDRANQGAERLLNARGLRNSGRELEALQSLNSGIVGSRVDSVLGNLFNLAGFGNTATGVANGALNNLAQAQQNNGTNLSNLALQGGNARASTFGQFGDLAANTALNAFNIFDLLGGSGGGGSTASSGAGSKSTSANIFKPGYK